MEDLIGLSAVKEEVRELEAVVHNSNLRRQYGMTVCNDGSNHLIFVGNPGTGKTTVARILGEIYRELGVVSKGHLVEVDREGLVDLYVGHTANKVKTKVREAYGGILFIDEVYSLVQDERDTYGKEAIDTLLKEMEDNRDKFVVIVAGYPKKMEKFLNSNLGLKSRFYKTVHFEDYSVDEMYEIFERMCKKEQYTITPEVRAKLKNKFSLMIQNKKEDFGNAREVRQIYQVAKTKLALRTKNVNNVNLTKEQARVLISTIQAVDIE